MLDVSGVSAGYGRIGVLKEITLRVGPGEIVAIVGANGAGKSTLLKTISGLVRARRGMIRVEDQEITHWAPEKIVRSGVRHVPEGRQLFGPLSVLDNLLLGAYGDSTLANRKAVMARVEQVYEIFPILRQRNAQRANTLSGGEQQMLAIGRALMGTTKLLLLDEPTTGLAPLIVREILNVILRLRRQGISILLVEQNARLAFSVATRAYVMETGRVVLAGTPEQLILEDTVRKAYLGNSPKLIRTEVTQR
ncbi:MAG: ABC transporter ATP-binding protein [Candidatus Tectomicrobia bacterium]|uniref:ABC transporter ATP-binding protein n=1 Tax=Tectimicrobiota bacterium TaxID=2528274 RepID=A0A932M1E1_UNCTE|nr:ABC transporter ATP-binding protein [Candidatus Tectomicrobia bacterium]